MAAWSDPALRRRWLDEAGVKVRTATAPKSMRLGWPDGTIVAVWFTAKGPSKSAVALAHTKLSDRETADRFKAYWAERLQALANIADQTNRGPIAGFGWHHSGDNRFAAPLLETTTEFVKL